jgi:rubrerythrin
MASQGKAKSVMIGNSEAGFAGESMAHIQYRYFARLAREAGADDVAKILEASADQGARRVSDPLDLRYP